MLNDVINGIDAELLDKAIIKLRNDESVKASELLEEIAMSCGVVANCRGLLALLDEDIKTGVPQESAIGFKMLETVMLGVMLGISIATDKEAIEEVELPEEAQEDIANHRTLVATALAGKISNVAD